MIGNITSTFFTFGIGYYIGKNYDEYVSTIVTNLRKSDHPPLTIDGKNVKIYGVTLVSYKPEK